MVDWARNSEDRVVIPKSIFTPVSSKGKYEDNLGFEQRILIKSFNKTPGINLDILNNLKTVCIHYSNL